MEGVAVVGADHEARRLGHGLLLQALGDGGEDAVPDTGEEVGQCALAARGADLLVVEEGDELELVAILGLHDGPVGGICAHQVVKAGRGDESVIVPPEAAGCAVDEAEVPGKDVVLVHTELLREQLPEALLVGTYAKKGFALLLHADLLSLVDLPVLVDRKRGDHSDGPGEVDEAAFDPCPLRDLDAPCQ